MWMVIIVRSKYKFVLKHIAPLGTDNWLDLNTVGISVYLYLDYQY
jgi:hypothetical protein